MILTNMKALFYMFTCWESNLCAFLFWCQLCDQERLHTLLYYRSIALAANKAELPDMKMLALFGFGTVILRGAACTVNDLLDRDIDKKVTFFFFNFRSDVVGCFLLSRSCQCLGRSYLINLPRQMHAWHLTSIYVCFSCRLSGQKAGLLHQVL